MKVAVIGGTRHVGPDIVCLLVEAGHRVQVYNRGLTESKLPDGVEHITVDRRVQGQLGNALKNHRPEVVIDMICYSVNEIVEVLAALPSLHHYIFCSSTVVYGRIGDNTPNELSPVDMNDVYGRNKAECDMYLVEQYHQDGIPFTSLRLSHPYGPRDHLLYTTGRESLFLDRMRKQRPIIIPGNGATRIHPIYVKDAARAFIHVLNRAESYGKIYNLAGDEILTLDDYFRSISRVLGVPLIASKYDRDYFRENAPLWAEWKRRFDFGYNWVDYQNAVDVSLLKQTGFQCHTDHDAGILHTLHWLDGNALIDLSGDDDEEDRILNEM